MCGIFFVSHLHHQRSDIIENAFYLGKHRGPDDSRLISFNNIVKPHSIYKINDYFMGFHRLSINGLDSTSGQPFIKNHVYVICNGEIYNFKKLYDITNIKQETNSDCEIIIDLYLNGYSIEKIVNMLDGVFAFVLYDLNIDTVFAARDPFGIRPLFYCYNNFNSRIMFASEMKQLIELSKINNKSINIFPPGHYIKFDKSTINNKFIKYYTIPNGEINCIERYPNFDTYQHYYQHYYQHMIKTQLINSVKKRLLSDRPIACLLSGGLDSSLICSIVCSLLLENKQKLHTFSIGMAGSTDLYYAKKVSDYLGTVHTEIVVSEDDFFDAIPEVIEKIESYDTTTVRASVGNYLISKYISKNTDFKVIFNGDGSDELTGGYLYFHNSPNQLASDCEVRRLLKDIHYFDVLRSDKSISSCGLEPRTPFLDKSFVNSYLSVPIEYRFPKDKIEKYLLRMAFMGYLPDEILFRKKEAFSDGVSSQNNSWFQIIQERLKCYHPKNVYLKTEQMYSKLTLEQKYYRDIFDKLYPNHFNIIPYYWMPKWSNTNDASARTLEIYNKKN